MLDTVLSGAASTILRERIHGADALAGTAVDAYSVEVAVDVLYHLLLVRALSPAASFLNFQMIFAAAAAAAPKAPIFTPWMSM